MGWSNCGTDDSGRPIGYEVEATCDHPECQSKIDRGLSYCCGGMHGGEPLSNEDGAKSVTTCGGYFCADHLFAAAAYAQGYDKERLFWVCKTCYEEIEKTLAL